MHGYADWKMDGKKKVFLLQLRVLNIYIRGTNNKIGKTKQLFQNTFIPENIYNEGIL